MARCRMVGSPSALGEFVRWSRRGGLPWLWMSESVRAGGCRSGRGLGWASTATADGPVLRPPEGVARMTSRGG